MDNCPKCQNPSILNGGKYIETPEVKLNTKIRIFFWIPINISFKLRYCMNCGFIACRDIKPGL